MTKLYAPESYWKYGREQLSMLVNGCGPEGWKRYFIPDNILWISIKEACDIHDFMYIFGESEKDREEADRVFKYNMMRVVEGESRNVIMLWARRRIALYYYNQVRSWGGTYFWQDKNPEKTFKNPKEVFSNATLGATPG